MKIRWKLMILLLAIALVPLVIASAVHRASMRRLGHRLASGTRDILTESSRRRLQLLVHNYARLLDRDRQLLELTVRHQAEAIERRLAGAAPAAPRLVFSRDMDRGVSLPPEMERPDNRYQFLPDRKRVPMPVSFAAQVYFVAEGVDRAAALPDMARLSTMPEVYRLLRRQTGEILYWQYAALESGVHMSYPAHGGYPDDYDPRRRAWYRSARDAGEMIWQPPIVDVTTRQPVLTVSMPFRGPRGRIAGVTAVDVLVHDLFQDLELPADWRAEEATLFVAPAGADQGAPPGAMRILAEKDYLKPQADWRKPYTMRLLESRDADALEALKADALAGRSGVRELRFRGRPAMWAYGGNAPGHAFPVVIVPTERIVARAVQAEKLVLDRTIEGLRLTGLILAGVVLVVVAAAFLSARSVTRPVNELAAASQKLAGGDYDARVEIRTRDELQTLGEAFNDMGPKLHERERMKRSLELAMEIQQHLLPQESPELAGFEIAGRSLYCDETGGDYYDFIDLVDLGPGKLGIAVGDVTGHGIGAALLMASARAVLRSQAPRHGAELGELFGDLNRHLVRDTGEDRFMTLFYGVLDAASGSLCWTSGGYDPPLWLRRATGEIEELPNAGIPLGILDEAAYRRDGPVTLEAGDVLLIGTDGIWEAQDPRGGMFGKHRLRSVLQACADDSAEDIHDAVVQAVRDFRGPEPQADDITLVVIKALSHGARGCT